jgi:enoyl-CoA hydratase
MHANQILSILWRQKPAAPKIESLVAITTGGNMDYSAYRYLKIEMRESIAVVTLNKPEKRNSYDDRDHLELITILNDLAADADVRVALFTGAGTEFCAGHDRRDLAKGAESSEKRLLELEQIRAHVHALLDFEKPLVTALTGVALGAPLTLALLGDIVVADRGARLSSPQVRFGLVPATGIGIWPLFTGLLRAKRHLMLGDWIGAEEAVSIGLVSEVVDEGLAFGRAIDHAVRLAAMPQQSMRYTKRALNAWIRRTLGDVLEPALSYEFLCMGSDEYREGLAKDVGP